MNSQYYLQYRKAAWMAIKIHDSDFFHALLKSPQHDVNEAFFLFESFR